MDQDADRVVAIEAPERDVAAFATFLWEAWEDAGPDAPGLAGARSAMNTRSHPPQPALEPRGVRRLAEVVSTVPVPVIAIVSGFGITVLVVAGVLQRTAYPVWNAANLDSEESVATWFSAALLWTAAACWLLVFVTARPRLLAVGIWWLVLAGLALDEGIGIHERLERWSGIDWQVLYLPVMGIAAAAWWGVVRRHRAQRSTTALLVAGAVAWATALLLELVQNWGGEPVKASIYDPAMITEEAFEMIASTVLVIAAILALRRSMHREQEGDGRGSAGDAGEAESRSAPHR